MASIALPSRNNKRYIFSLIIGFLCLYLVIIDKLIIINVFEYKISTEHCIILPVDTADTIITKPNT